MPSSKIQTLELKGHKEAVLCLDHNSSASPSSNGPVVGCLLSGSEDGTARLWDLRSSPRASTCIIAGEEVTSVAFGPTTTGLKVESDFCRDYTVYLSSGGIVNAYDLRRADAPLVREASLSLIKAEDDINQIVVSDGKKDGSFYLASGDDSGVVQIVSTNRTKESSQPRILEHGSEALVTSCVFRPRSKNLELASGGTDCRVCLWDVNKPKRPLCSKVISTNQTGAQVCNPPMVHSLAWSPSGQLLAAGLGDGTSSVFALENRSLVEVARIQDLSQGDCPVASVVFPSFVPSEPKKVHPTNQDRLLAVIRNDAVINMWDLGWTVAGEKAINPSETKLGSIMCDGETKSTKANLEDKMDDLSLLADQPNLLFKIQHSTHKKPNWIVSSSGNGDHFPSSLFVADTSPDIAAYTVPL